MQAGISRDLYISKHTLLTTSKAVIFMQKQIVKVMKVIIVLKINTPQLCKKNKTIHEHIFNTHND